MFTFEVKSDDAAINAFREEIKEKTMEQKLGEAMEEIMHLLFTSIVLKSPVRTGTYKRSWDCKQMSPDLFLIFSSDNAGKCWALEFGHSQQAPEGVCRITWLESQDEINKILKKHLKKKKKTAKKKAVKK